MSDCRREHRNGTGRGVIVAAPASGSGKTLVMAGLLRHLRRRGLSVAAAKAGPDFIDPTFHAAASGRTCLNLDAWAMRRTTLAGLGAELERLTGWPVVLVVDAHGQGASVAALLRGFATHEPRVQLAGVIFNRVASGRHRALLAAAVAHHLPDIACLGALPWDPALTLPSRHLGL